MTDAEIFALADEGEGDFMTDSATQMRATTLLRQRQQLKRVLFRRSCPDGLALGEYGAKLLPAGQMRLVREHVGICLHCSAELQAHKAFLLEVGRDISAPTLLDRVRVFVAELLPSAPQGQLAFGLRGAADEGPLMYEADGVQVSIEVQDDGSRPGTKVVLGFVMNVDPAGWQAQLYLADQLVQTTAVDEFGNFLIAGLASGDYQLILAGADRRIHIQSLSV